MPHLAAHNEDFKNKVKAKKKKSMILQLGIPFSPLTVRDPAEDSLIGY